MGELENNRKIRKRFEEANRCVSDFSKASIRRDVIREEKKSTLYTFHHNKLILHAQLRTSII